MLSKISLLCLETNTVLRWELIFPRSAVNHTPEERKQKSEFYRLRKNLRQNPEEFFETLHLSLDVFKYILKHVRHKLDSNTITIKNLTAEEKLFITLRYLSSGLTFKELSKTFLIGNSTASKTVAKTLAALWETFHQTHLAPPKRHEMANLAEEFYVRWRFPNCIGAIGGKCIALHKKKSWKKSLTSCVILYATSDAEFRFQTVATNNLAEDFDYTFHGVFFNTGSSTAPEDNIKLPYVLVGNKAFPLKKNLLRPFPNTAMNYQKGTFNNRLEKARFTIDAAFEILVHKWQLLQRALELHYDYATVAVKVCCLLNNIIKDVDGFKDRDFYNYSQKEAGEKYQDMVTKLSKKNNRSSSFAIQIRDRFADYLVTHE